MTAPLDEMIEEIRRLHELAERWRLEHAGLVAGGYEAEFEVSVRCRFIGDGGDVVATWDRCCGYDGDWDPEAFWRPGRGYARDATLGELEAYLFAPDREIRELRRRIADSERAAEVAAEQRAAMRRELAALEAVGAGEVAP